MTHADTLRRLKAVRDKDDWARYLDLAGDDACGYVRAVEALVLARDEVAQDCEDCFHPVVAAADAVLDDLADALKEAE